MFDRNESGQEGPWVTFARMLTLRTPKHITEPDLGVPSLTPRSWFSAVHGEAAGDALTKSGRTGRRTSTGTDRCCSSLSRMAATSPTSCLEGALPRLIVRTGDRTREVLARKIVLATGIDGGAPGTCRT